MSFFSRATKSDNTSRIRKDGNFASYDTGGKDAGASKRTIGGSAPEPASHMRDIADQHMNEGDLHNSIAGKMKMVGLDKRAAEHKEVADHHMLAGAHYGAAANAIEGARDRSDPMTDQKGFLDAGKDHLAQARQCAGKAQTCTEAFQN